ncbi:MAG: homoserine dehydrogenase [Clostridiales Family XIII bacterium]|jgi:homoserine dehydrogenase|nr:homoserine dehydrogenase [Clostridiales Family XIII bacterium]
MKQIKIGLLGMGNIGTGAYKTLEMNKARIAANTGLDLTITRILEKDLARERDVTVVPEQFTQEADDILAAPDIDIVIELLGGLEPATSFMLTAMQNGKHVVTANKAAVAASYDKLLNTARANRVMFRFEASVGGGIPILNALTTALSANEYEEIRGILNGTTNYILTQMAENGLSYDRALKAAQEQGFAEADPTADVEGHDVANKLSILISLAFGKRVPPENIPTVGITGLTMRDIEKAAADGGKLKLIALARRKGDDIEYSVAPTFVANDHPLAGVRNEFNAIFVRGNAVGELMFYGKGAGPLPTGSAVMGDVTEIARAIAR